MYCYFGLGCVDNGLQISDAAKQVELPTWFICQHIPGEGACILSGYKNNFILHGENYNAFAQNM